MKRLLICFLFLGLQISNAQATANEMPQAVKDSLYIHYSKIVKNYSLKQFEELFFDFKRRSFKETLTKDEFYNYTIKIAAFSERYAGLYPKEKEIAEKSKKEWLSKTYTDYLNSKKAAKRNEK